MKFKTTLFIFLAISWAALSGETSALLISLGVFSCALVTLIVSRMNYHDGDWHPFDIKWHRLPGYVLWLCWEMLMSNFSVARAILLQPTVVRPRRFLVDASNLSELGQVIYADSITLTPGTVSLFLRDGKIEVHALLEDAASSLEAGDMRKKVEHLYELTELTVKR